MITKARHSGRLQSFYKGSDYTPETIGSWVAVDDRDMPWNTIGKALEHSSGNGSTVDHKMTAAEALKITGLDFDVKKAPVKDADTGRVIPKMFTTYRDLEEAEGGRFYFGAVSDKYRCVPPRENLAFVDDLVANHEGAHYTAVWDMRQFAMMGVTVEFPETIVIDPNGANDVLGLYGLGINSFDGSTGLQFATTAMRFWCMNQLPPSLKIGDTRIPRSVSFKHTTNVMSRASDARTALGVSLNWAQHFDAIANSLFTKSMTDRQFERLVSTLPGFVLDGSETTLKKSRVLGRRDEVVSAWRAPHNANITGTRWGAFNVLGEYADWGRKVNGSKRSGASPAEQRAIGTMCDVTPFKTKVLDTLVTMR